MKLFKLIFASILAILPVFAGFAYDFESDGIYYTITGSNTVSVVSGDYAYEGDITIPSYVGLGGKTYLVTAIGEEAFKSTNIENVVLPEGLLIIGNNAFYQSSIKTINFPSTLTSMGSSAFYECRNLTGVVLPDALKEIKEYAFYECNNLRTLMFGNATTRIEQYAFYNTGIQQLAFPSTMKDVAHDAFASCKSLQSLKINDAAVFLAGRSFDNCTNLVSIDLGNAVTGFGRYSEYINEDHQRGPFSSCTSLTQIVIPASITDLQYTFYGCSRLYDVTLPNTLVSIGPRTFQNCAIRELEVPANVQTIGNYAFCNCPLASVTLSSSLLNIGDYAFSACPLTAIQFPATLKSIGICAFENTKITEIVIPSSLTDIYNRAFSNNINLRKVKIENASVKMTSAFCGCSALVDVDLGNAVVELNTEGWERNGCFYDCINLATISLPATIKALEDGIFKNCSSLVNVTLPNTITSIGAEAFQGCTQLKTLLISNSLQSIGDNAFDGCHQLQSINLPASQKSIGHRAFKDCSSLTNILIPENVSYLGKNAFEGCTSMESVVFDNSVLSIEEYTFSGCKNLQNVELGKVTTICNNVFNGCSKLEKIVIPNSVEELQSSFVDCTSLKDVVIGTGLKSLRTVYWAGVGFGVFYGCTKLSSIKIASKVLTSVDGGCFFNCKSLKKIELPASVTSIGEYTFAGCNELLHIYMNPTTPPGISDNTFSDYNTPTLHVPSSAKTSYSRADNWKNFANIIAIGSEPQATAEEIAALDALLTEALALYNGSIEGTEPGNYPTGAKAALKAVINDVEDRFSNTMLTDDVEDCIELLNTAMKSFKNKQVKNEIQTNNTLAFAGSLKAARGSEFRLPIEMNNTDAITGVQFDLYLPEGMILSEDEYGDYMIELSRTTTRRHSIASRKMPDGALRVVVSSSQNATFSDNSGTLLTLVLFPKSSLEAGDYDVTLKNIILTDPDAKRYAAADMKSVITVSNYTMGDVNNDGYIDVADLAGVVRFILENADASMVFNAADMDGNGVIEVNDYAALVNIILSQNNQGAKRRAMSSENRETLVSLTDLNLDANGRGELMVRLTTNNARFTGLQFDLQMPEGVELTEEGIEAISRKHGAWMIRREDGTYRIVCASMVNAELGEGDVLRISVKAENGRTINADMLADNVVLADVVANRYESAAMTANVKFDESATGIMAIEDDVQGKSVYDLQGRPVQTMQKGIYVIDGKKVVVR